ncbi:Glycosyl phosphatidyl inositol protein transamidase complex subunit [Coemansia sp. RSA 989]|nr:Gaa1-like protein [Coemansia mojavensis]KAJ1739033.1 Glycosyl phosphatidyl inositol protein transamidase complex subunit [Coemansia sp. RSA 1086]KAJ1747458.1 Glycosyl phosphatidyl inositol protein transamidase complex subunit [Coemansia sp. RSA 1821]KAJ1861666.1 Glycosyl phosphatidyl inositol protein transamidase complex subunit [Coemansia sp. RSA 989]KAJ1869588.1 Glycosyl phosphatidyl inositol protein transamidase complex subunit [Coemansia sp. RSA 990]KAJ2631318.1 Glycosyl phosphatidyl in
MSLVLSGQGEKTSPLLRAARKYSAYLSYPLAICGLLWLLALPSSHFWRRVYFSENAMLPGQVQTSFGAPSHLDAMKQLDTALQAADRAQGLESVFADMGLDTEIQHFGYDKIPRVENATGTNVHGILKARRSDSVEALVIAASWTTADNDSNVNGVRLLAGLAKYASEQTFWARDIIFVVTDSGEIGIEAWLRAYQGLSTNAPLFVRSGIIQAALSIELPPAKMYSGLGVHFEGKGGQLANLDYVNMVQYVSRLERMPAYLHGVPDVSRKSSWWTKYRAATQMLLRQVRTQAFGSSTGIHAPFLRYRIDAITLAGIPRANDPVSALFKSQNVFADTDVPELPSAQQIGRTIEATMRSLNNLLERFHQSFFFYMLPANQRYLSIGDYVPAAALMIASLLVQAMHLWWMQGPKELRSDNPQTRITRINAYYQLLRSTLPSSIRIILRVHCFGLVLLLVPRIFASSVLSDTTTTAYLFTMALASISMVLHTADTYWSHASKVEWRQLKALVDMYVAVIIACLSVMNFSLAIALFVVAGLPLVLTRAWKIQSRYQRALGILLLLFASPVSTMTLGRNVVLGLHPLDFTSSPFRMFLTDFYHFGSLVYPLVCLVYWPVNLLSMIIVLVPEANTSN